MKPVPSVKRLQTQEIAQRSTLKLNVLNQQGPMVTKNLEPDNTALVRPSWAQSRHDLREDLRTEPSLEPMPC
jgi:hypothetical protein